MSSKSNSPVYQIPFQRDTVAIIAPGPSLRKEDIEALYRRPDIFTIAIGDAWRWHPHADILYHCDYRWWNYYKYVPEFKGGQRVSFDDLWRPDVHKLLGTVAREGLSLTPPSIVTGQSSGYQALNLAVHFKPKTIIITGMDMKDTNGKHNIIGQHPIGVKMPCNFKKLISNFDSTLKPLAELGITVYNCTRDSALECFPKKDLKDVLAQG